MVSRTTTLRYDLVGTNGEAKKVFQTIEQPRLSGQKWLCPDLVDRWKAWWRRMPHVNDCQLN
jgi:hypothetical protein